LEGEQKRGRKTKGAKGVGTTSSKAKPRRGTMAIIAKASGMAEEVRGSTTVGIGRACSNEGSGENECSNSMPHSENRVGTA